MLDRTQAPPIRAIQNIRIPEIETYSLPGGRNLYVHREPNSMAFKIELLTEGGNTNGRNGAEVQLGLKILGEGTINKTSHQISEQIDSLGSFLEVTPGFDNSSISIFGLKKFFNENISLLSEIIYQPAFLNKSLNLLKQKEKNKLKLNLEKGSYISSINLRKAIFSNHPYGHSLTFDELDRITIIELQKFYISYLKSFDIYLSGDIPNDFFDILVDQFPENFKSISPSITTNQYKPNKLDHRDPKYIQSSIKLGKSLFNRSHPDYFKFIVTNELLGGFFGSRLMKNIREEKGYTYGIYSALYPLAQEGYFLISTDVKGDNEQETLREIQTELDRLSSETVKEEELEIVKNYMIGSFINSFGSPFASITKFKAVNTHSLTLDFYKEYIQQVRSVSIEHISEIAQAHLNFNSLSVSLVGR